MRQEPSPTHVSPAQAILGVLTEMIAAALLLLVGLAMTTLSWVTHRGPG